MTCSIVFSMRQRKKQSPLSPARVLVRPIPDEVRAPLTAEARATLAEIERQLPALSRRKLLTVALTLGLRYFDRRPADALADLRARAAGR